MLQRQQERVKTTQTTTVNYDLPLWDGQEVTSWMTQMNDAMDKIDSAMWANKTGVDNEKVAVDNANQAATNANEKLESLGTWQTTIENDVDIASKDAAKAKGDAAQALQGAANATTEVQALQEIVNTQGDDISRLAGEIQIHEISRVLTISDGNKTVETTIRLRCRVNNNFLIIDYYASNQPALFTLNIGRHTVQFDSISDDVISYLTSIGKNFSSSINPVNTVIAIQPETGEILGTFAYTQNSATVEIYKISTGLCNLVNLSETVYYNVTTI